MARRQAELLPLTERIMAASARADFEDLLNFRRTFRPAQGARLRELLASIERFKTSDRTDTTVLDRALPELGIRNTSVLEKFLGFGVDDLNQATIQRLHQLSALTDQEYFRRMGQAYDNNGNCLVEKSAQCVGPLGRETVQKLKKMAQAYAIGIDDTAAMTENDLNLVTRVEKSFSQNCHPAEY